MVQALCCYISRKFWKRLKLEKMENRKNCKKVERL
nr:MAG TPA: Protein of unknown function (DUF3966) [Bacteriophage sp.]